jgi:hypothetical protein
MRVLFFLLAIYSCSEKSSNPYANLNQTHKSSDSSIYTNLDKDWTERVYDIDEVHSSYVKEMNQIDGFDEKPVKTDLTLEKKKMLYTISKSFNKKINDYFNRYVYAIYFCKNLGGTGITGFIYDNKKNIPVGGFIIFDAKVLDKKANDWISFKENSVFKKEENLELKIKIEKESENSEENALRYILLHEMGHVLSNTLGYSSDMRSAKEDYSKIKFYNGVWKNPKESIYDQSIFPFRKKIIFYAEPKEKLFLSETWKSIYPNLAKTRFSTLYGAMNPMDHFAESFVSYVHCVLDKRIWELEITEKDKVIYKMENLIFKNKEEVDFFKQLLENNPTY